MPESDADLSVLGKDMQENNFRQLCLIGPTLRHRCLCLFNQQMECVHFGCGACYPHYRKEMSY